MRKFDAQKKLSSKIISLTCAKLRTLTLQQEEACRPLGPIPG